VSGSGSAASALSSADKESTNVFPGYGYVRCDTKLRLNAEDSVVIKRRHAMHIKRTLNHVECDRWRVVGAPVSLGKR
jgi:hypothetical protein